MRVWCIALRWSQRIGLVRFAGHLHRAQSVLAEYSAACFMEPRESNERIQPFDFTQRAWSSAWPEFSERVRVETCVPRLDGRNMLLPLGY